MSAFLGYVFLGLSLAAPIGPVNAAQLDKGIKSGFFHAWLVGLGAVIADGFYMAAVFLGLVHVLDIPFVKTFLWSFGFFVLVYTGIESIWNAGKVSLNSRSSDESILKSFLSGFLMSITNPLTIMFWLGIYGSVLAKTVAENEFSTVLLSTFAIFAGLLLWDVTMAGVASSFRKLLSDRILVFISVLSGLSLIGFGLYFGLQALKMLF